MNTVPPMPVGVQARLSFHCSGCGRELIAGLEAAGIEAPCPSCGTSVRAPILGPAPEPVAPAPTKADSVPQRHGSGIPADGIVDHRQIENRENVNLLRILLSVGLVMAIVAVVVALVWRSHFGG